MFTIRNSKTALELTLAGALTLASASIAMADVDVAAGLKTGLSYDTNVGVESLGLSGGGDVANNLSLWVGAKTSLTKALTLEGKYKLSDSRYQEYNEFNQRGQQFKGALKTKFDTLRLGLSYTRFLNSLDGSDFLDMEVINPSVGALVSKSVYVQAAYSRYNKNFETLNDRDAETDVGNLNAFYFFDNYRSFVNISVAVENENASGDQFDYEGYSLGASIDIAVDWFGNDSKINFASSYRNRDFENPTPSIAARRHDEKLILGLMFETPLSDLASVSGGYQNIDRSSNLASADYVEQIFSVDLTVRF